MKILPKTNAPYALISRSIPGKDSGKGEAKTLARSLIASGQFREEQLAILHNDRMDTWWVAQTKATVKKPLRTPRDEVRNPVGYKAKAFGFNPSAAV